MALNYLHKFCWRSAVPGKCFLMSFKLSWEPFSSCLVDSFFVVYCEIRTSLHHVEKKAYRPNFLSGSDFLPPRLPPRPPPRPRPRPFPLTNSFFLNGTKSLVLIPSSPGPLPSPPLTGTILGKRYLGTYFICDWIRVGCNGLSWRR